MRLVAFSFKRKNTRILYLVSRSEPQWYFGSAATWNIFRNVLNRTETHKTCGSACLPLTFFSSFSHKLGVRLLVSCPAGFIKISCLSPSLPILSWKENVNNSWDESSLRFCVFGSSPENARAQQSFFPEKHWTSRRKSSIGFECGKGNE